MSWLRLDVMVMDNRNRVEMGGKDQNDVSLRCNWQYGTPAGCVGNGPRGTGRNEEERAKPATWAPRMYPNPFSVEEVPGATFPPCSLFSQCNTPSSAF